MNARIGRIARRLLEPPPPGLRRRDYLRTLRQGPFVPGSCQLFGRRTWYADRTGFLHSVRELFEQEVYRFAARDEAPRIIDAGANIGLSIRYFKQLYPACEIVAFEPDPQMFELLTKNVAHLSGIEARQEAAWIENTTLTFYKEGSLAGSSEVDFLGHGESITVRATRLKDEIERAPVDFLKIDIEGAENTVLFDIESALPQVDTLFFEYHSVVGKDQRLGDLLGLVRRAGFRYAISDAHAVAHPFVERRQQGFDLQANVFCYREAA